MTSKNIVSLLDRLNGQKFAEIDVKWMWDLPIGKDLLQFLAAQSQGDSEVSLDDIALEHEEYDLWNKAVEAGLVTTDPSLSSDREASYLPREYKPPSTLQKNLDDIGRKQILMDLELSRLNQCITRVREVTAQTSKIHKKLSIVQQETSKSVARLEDELSQFSLTADSTISSVVRAACYLATDQVAVEQNVKRNQELVELLTLLSGTYTDVAQLLTMHLPTNGCESLSNKSAHSLREEVKRLSYAISSLERRHIAVSNEGVHQNHLENALIEQRMHESSPWVEETTENIWNAEQASYLFKKIDTLKKITMIVEGEILPPITFVNACLAALKTNEDETLVAIQALLDELDDIEVDVNHITNAPTIASTHPTDTSIRELLRRLRSLRPSYLPPLTLVGHSDILTELSGIRSRHEDARADMKEVEIGSSIDAHIMMVTSRDYLSNLLIHTPTNTSPPVSIPQNIQQEVYNAKQQIAEVSQVLNDTPDEILTGSRARRRMDAFIQSTMSS